MSLILAEAWEGVLQLDMSPGFLIVPAVCGAIVFGLGILKRVLVSRARKLMWAESGTAAVWTRDGLERAWIVEGLIRGRIDRHLNMTWGWMLAAFRRPRTIAACWYIAGVNDEKFAELLTMSRDAERFGSHLLAMAWKVMKDDVDDPVEMWRRLMAYADRPAEERERLAAPGYSLTVSLMAVEHGLPLEYAEAMCSSSDRLSLVAA